jgi:proteasome accessory factor B
VGIEPRLGTSEPAFDAVKNAVVGQQTIEFGYRTGGEGQVRVRRVQPWGLASWHGRWYLTGHDLDREAPRVFRLSRIDGEVRRVGRPGGYAVPADHRAQEMIRTTVGEQAARTATVRVREGRGQALRRRGASTSGAVADPPWTRLEITFTDAESFADEVSGYGPDVVVESPQDVRDLVIGRLRGAIQAHPGGRGVA